MRDDAIHEADALGFARVDDVGQEHELLGAVHADEPRQQPRAAEIDDEATLREDLAEARSVGRDDQVAAERKVATGAGRDAVHRRDRRLGQLVQPQRGPTHDSHPGQRRGGTATRVVRTVAEVRARAESVARAGDHEHAVFAILGHFVEERGEPEPHLARHRVLLGRPVQRARHDTVGALDEQGVHRGEACRPGPGQSIWSLERTFERFFNEP